MMVDAPGLFFPHPQSVSQLVNFESPAPNLPMVRVSDERALWIARHILPHEAALRAWLSGRRVFDLEVDDIVQEAYARLAEVKSVADIGNPKAYFFQAAYSVIATHLRRAQVVSIRAVGNIEALGGESEAASPETLASDRDELYRIAAIIDTLPSQVRAVFALRRIEGLSQRETAQRLRLSESTVEKHMARGLRLFMDAVGRSGFSPPRASNRKVADTRSKHGKTQDQS